MLSFILLSGRHDTILFFGSLFLVSHKYCVHHFESISLTYVGHKSFLWSADIYTWGTSQGRYIFFSFLLTVTQYITNTATYPPLPKDFYNNNQTRVVFYCDEYGQSYWPRY